MLVHLVSDRDVALARYGSRSYRLVNQRAGTIAHRISTMAATGALAARITNSYNVRRLRDLFRLERDGETPVFQILIGVTRPPSRYTSRLEF
jgi:hypothetical protein